MKCPLIVFTDIQQYDNQLLDRTDCLEQKCGWWDEEKNCCSVPVIAKELTRLQLQKGGRL